MTGPGGVQQFLRRAHAELVVKRMHAAWPEAGDLQQVGDPTRKAGTQPFQLVAGAALEHLADLACQVLADAGQFVEVATLCGPLAHLLRPGGKRACRVAVGTYAERIGLLQFEQIGDLLERGGDGGVVDGHEDDPMRGTGGCTGAGP